MVNDKNKEPDVDRYLEFRDGLVDQKLAVKEDMKEIEIDAGENMYLKNKNDKLTNKVLIKKLVGDMRSMIEDNFFEGLLVEEKLKDRYLQNEPTIV